MAVRLQRALDKPSDKQRPFFEKRKNVDEEDSEGGSVDAAEMEDEVLLVDVVETEGEALVDEVASVEDLLHLEVLTEHLVNTVQGSRCFYDSRLV